MDTTEVLENHKFNIQNLKDYLDRLLSVPASQQEQVELKQFTSGQSNPTFYLKYRTEEYVLRKKPPGKLLKGAHLVEREFKIISALHAAAFPVPKPIALCTDVSVIGTEFYLMSYVKGRIFRGDNLELRGQNPDERREIYAELQRVMIQLHSLDVKAIGLGDLSQNPELFYQKQIETWGKNYKLAETDPIKDMDDTLEWLRGNLPAKNSDNQRISIVHGDYRLDNVIFHETEPRILAVLDWELTALGSPLADIAYMCMAYYSFPQLLGYGKMDFTYSGLPHEFTVRSNYCKQMKLNQEISDKDWYFYLCFSFFRLAAISQGVYKRSLQGNASSSNGAQFHKNSRFLANRCRLMMKKSAGEVPENSKLRGIFSSLSPRYFEVSKKLEIFMDKYVYPNEQQYFSSIPESGKPRWQHVSPLLKQLQARAKEEGLWNLFLPSVSKLTNLEYAPLCEIMGRSFLAPVVFNCSAPDTGNMEVLHLYGSKEQKQQWLEPLLSGEIRSMYGMTEPAVASSDATNVSLTITKCPIDPNYYIVNGRKWWSSGAGDPLCKVAIVMGVTPNKQKPRHQQHSQIIVPMNEKGVQILRPLLVFGYDDAPHGHMEVDFRQVRVPASNLILGEGRGFEISQGRLGPGRIHHCMRLIGLMERCFDAMCDRVGRRTVFGKKIQDNDNALQIIGECRTKIDAARLLTLNAAKMIDNGGAKNARIEISTASSMIKIMAPRVACEVIDAAIQLHGGAGVSQDTHLAWAYINARTLRLADGPDEVHLMSVAKEEMRRYHPRI